MAACWTKTRVGIRLPEQTLLTIAVRRRPRAVFRSGHNPIALPFYRERRTKPGN